MKKYLFLFVLLCSIAMHAQRTTLTIDCPKEGWLRDLISTQDKLFVENLTITGAINVTDIAFLGELNKSYSLKHLNLSKAQIKYGEYPVINNNKGGTYVYDFEEGIFPILDCYSKLDYLELPENMVGITRKGYGPVYKLSVDTLIIGSNIYNTVSNYDIKANFAMPIDYLEYREGVTSVISKRENTSYSKLSDINKIRIPYSLRNIPDQAFIKGGEGAPAPEKAVDINLHDSIEFMGISATGLIDSDTIRIPSKMREWTIASFFFKENTVFYIHKDLKKIDNYQYNFQGGNYVRFGYGSQLGRNSTHTFHIASKTPPEILCSKAAEDDKHFAKNIVYVPKGCVEAYKNAPIWGQATILEEPVYVDSVRITPNVLQLRKGNTFMLSASVYPNDADNMEVVWNSSNSNIVSVDQNGLITALASGTAEITITSKENSEIKDVCTITVYQPVSKLQLGSHELTLKAGEEKSIRVEIEPTDADDKAVIWQSGNEDVATVSKGVVKGTGSGNTFVYAISHYDENIKDSCYVTVSQPVTGITLSESSLVLNGIGKTHQLEATVIPENASNKTVNWKSSNEGVCIVSSNGMLVTTGYGTAVVIATTEEGGHMAVCTVKVEIADGISELQNEQGRFDVYNLQGILILKDAAQKEYNRLPAGIYIINGQKVVKQ